MIHRILQLDIKDFRSYRGVHEIPLDAGVVLIHGPNGSGKTGLLSALECAVTGSVLDLQVFRLDYPRCLINDAGDGQANLALTFETAQKDKKTQTVNVTHMIKETAPRLLLTKEDRRFFSERSYLSQMRLGRLLEKYQSDDAEGQPLIKLLEELLGLDILDSLSQGLHEAGDTRRLEKSCPSLGLLKEQEKKLPRQLLELERQRTLHQQELNNLVDRYHGLVAKMNAPSIPESLATGSDWERLLEGMKQRQTEVERSLRQLRPSMGKLDFAKQFLSDPASEEDLDRLSTWRLQVEEINQRQEHITLRLAAFLKHLESHLHSSGPFETEGDVRANPSDCYDRMKSRLSNEWEDIKERLDMYNHTRQELQTVKRQLEEDLHVVGGLQSCTEARVKAHEWTGMLHAALSLMEGEVCPLCDRNYEEIGAGDLRVHVVRKLEQLGADLQRWDTMQGERIEKEIRIQKLSQRIKVLEEMSIPDDVVEVLQKRCGQLEGLVESMGEMEGEKQEWLDLDLRKKKIEQNIAAAESQLQHQAKSRELMKSLADELQIAAGQEPTEAMDLAGKLADELQQRINAFEREAVRCEHLTECLTEADGAHKQIALLTREMAELQLKIEEVEKARKEIDSVIAKARRISQAATNAKKHMLEHFLSRTFNDLWLDLYRRLAKTERFEPRLGEPVAKRRQISTRIQGIAEGSEPFEQLASVVSSGTLNTAALSLFLALHLIDEPRMHLLVLDDPVQNMDDVHVVEMTNLLRAIAHQANRQLILAVHERAMFEYLSLELSPSRPDDTLITVELSRDIETCDTSIQYTRHRWQPDSVSFGTYS